MPVYIGSSDTVLVLLKVNVCKQHDFCPLSSGIIKVTNHSVFPKLKTKKQSKQ